MSTLILTPTSPSGPAVAFTMAGPDSITTAGVGGWQRTDRPRRRSGLEFTGTPAYSFAVPVILNGVDADGPDRHRSVEPACRLLERWAGQPTEETNEPTVLAVAGPLRVPKGLRWVLNDLTWDDDVYLRAPGDGPRILQLVTLTFEEHTRATVIMSPTAKARQRNGQQDA